MNRDRPHRHLPLKSTEKSVPSKVSSQSKSKPLPNRTSKNQTIHHQSQGLNKMIKKESKTKIQKSKPPSTKCQVNSNLKSTPQTTALHMKSNLKQLISKNLHSKPKNQDSVPDLLRNIEKHCKQLKKIHEKQQKVSSKRPSLQQHKLQKDKRLMGANRSQDYQPKKKGDKTPKDYLQPEENRFSLQINPQQIKHDINPLNNDKLSKRPSQSTQNNANFYQLFKIYKKSFEVDEIKIQKSNKNTNYNTNQSKNSSSLYNSRGCTANVSECNSKSKRKLEDKVNRQKIETLIRSQQSSLSRQNNSSTKKKHDKAGQSISEFDQQNFRKIRQLQSRQRSHMKDRDQKQIEQVEETSVQIQEPKEFAKQIEGQLHLGGITDEQQSRQSSAKRSYEWGAQVLQKRFQNSKYYVQQMPKFIPKLGHTHHFEEEDSLAGCQITLLENNIVCQDSELLQFEL